jgi:type IV pilus assembly protein PilN
MRVDLNLATQPYEDVRDLLLRWGVLLVLVAIVAAGLVVKAVEGWERARDVNHQIATERAALSRTEDDIKRAEAVLASPANKQTVAQSQFLNELIARKAFSWTQVFTELERMMPGRLKVISIKPELDEQNQLKLQMTVAGSSLNTALDLLRKMEASKHFRTPQITAQSEQPNGTIGFQIETLYVPQPPQGDQAAPTTSASTSGAQ